MRCRGTEVRIAQAAEDSKQAIVWHLLEQSMVGKPIGDDEEGRRLRRKTAVARASAQ